MVLLEGEIKEFSDAELGEPEDVEEFLGIDIEHGGIAAADLEDGWLFPTVDLVKKNHLMYYPLTSEQIKFLGCIFNIMK